MKKIGVLGSGEVAQTLASGFLKHGYEVTLGSRQPEKLAPWREKNPGGATGTFADAAAAGEIVVVAVKGNIVSEVLHLAGTGNLAGKVVIDATNPIADAPPDNGVLRFVTDINGSMMEKLQAEFPDARFVKAFNSVGSALMINPQFEGGPPTMFICGSDANAKREVSAILEQFGWDAEDMGGVESARAIEPLCMLWCVRGFLFNEWGHAFKLLK
jgi:predicted dinucleotide-binding enzyme